MQKLDVIEIIGREEALPSCMMTLLKGIAPAPLGGPGWSNGLNRRLSWETSVGSDEGQLSSGRDRLLPVSTR